MKTAEDYARDLIGSQAMQIIGLLAQLDAARSRIQELEKTVFEMKGASPPRDEPKAPRPVLTDRKKEIV